MVLIAHLYDLSKGGVPGGVLDGEPVLDWCSLCKGGIHAKQTISGQGPKITPPQLVQGGVGGGVHIDEPWLGRGRCCAAGV